MGSVLSCSTVLIGFVYRLPPWRERRHGPPHDFFNLVSEIFDFNFRTSKGIIRLLYLKTLES